MAHARRRNVRGHARRRSAWVEMISEISSTNSGASVPRELVLLLPTNDSEMVTLVRIVGAVGMWLQSDQATVAQAMAWGIYIAGSGATSDMKMTPLNALDAQSEHWLHIRKYFGNTAFGTNVIESSQLFQQVDIRVKRKVAEGDGIKLVFDGAVAYRSIAHLRGLVLLP